MTPPYNPEFQFTDWPDGPLNANLPPDPLSPNAVLNQVEAEFENVATALTELPPAHLVSDSMGVDPVAYGHGEGRPPINLREAINALLAGRQLTTPDLPVSPGSGDDVLHRAVVTDTTGGLVVVWHSPRVNNVHQVYAARLDLAHPERGFSPAVPVTSGATANTNPTAVALPTGELIVAYSSQATADVVMKRAALANLPAATSQNVIATAGVIDQFPHAVLAGNRVVFLCHQASTKQWSYRRYDHAAGTFVDTAPVKLDSTTSDTNVLLHATAAGSSVLVAHTSGFVDMWRLRLNADGTIVRSQQPPSSVTEPFVLATSGDRAMVFHRSGNGLSMATAFDSFFNPAAEIPGTDGLDGQPSAVQDTDGTIYLFYTRRITEAGETPVDTEIVLRHWSPITAEWDPPRRVTRQVAIDQQPHPILVPGHGIWLVYLSNRTGNSDLYATRVLTAI